MNPLRARALVRRTGGVVAALSVLAASTLVTSGPAHAADKTPFIVVGTSDVSDSNLMAGAIEPAFEAAYPQYDLQYVPKGTGAAITYAEQGSADALLVHAASLENQFVQQGFSTEQYGRAIFWGDYVLLGPKSDPAGVAAADPHNIAGAFQKVATAGAAGKADFVSRSGTPGTTVQEHAIWGLTTGTTLCQHDATNGGGATPSTTGGACPSTVEYPSWYHSGDRLQAANVENADVCPYTSGNCYVLTDRGTYQYLKSTNAIGSNLQVLVQNNTAANAPGGVSELVNSFHAYGINPAAIPNSKRTINTEAANDFLSFITSPAGQSAVGAFLADDPNGRPFIPDASPTITTGVLPATAAPGQAVTFSGTLANVVPGTPALANKPVTITSAPDVTPAPAQRAFGTTTTDANGHFSITWHASQNLKFGITTPPTSQIENATLSPVFGDLLQRTTNALTAVHVVGLPVVTNTSVARKGQLDVSGTLAPVVRSANAFITIYTRPFGSTGPFVNRGQALVKQGSTTFSQGFKLAKGKTVYRIKYDDPTNIDAGLTPYLTTTVG